MGRHRMYQHGIGAGVGDLVVVGGDEAHHAARVKRVEVGDGVEVLGGTGVVVRGRVAEIRKKARGEGWEVVVGVEEVEREERLKPRVEVWSAVPKGDRLEEMVDHLVQVGVAEWAPLRAARSVVDPRAGKLERVERRAAEASKQCGRAWAIEMGAGGGMGEALAGGSVVIADASGGPYRRSGADRVRVLVGPEGGWEESELALARAKGAVVAVFGPHVMRLETAAVVAAAVVRAVETSDRG